MRDAFANRRFTLAGIPELEAGFPAMLDGIAADVAALPVAGDIAGIILGGGYGRGEGGARRLPDGGCRLYNDLDFFVIAQAVPGVRRRQIDVELAGLGRTWSARLGIDVDFGPCRTAASLDAVRDTLMYQELKANHLVIFGDDRVLDALPAADFSRIPKSEAARLLLNRGAGLLLAEGKFGESATEETEDFISRNIWKAVLGCGDALLIAAGTYCDGVRSRAARLAARAEPAGIGELYAEAVRFKEFPFFADRPALRESWQRAVALWLASVGLLFDCPASASPERIQAAILASPVWREGKALRHLIRNLLLIARGETPGRLFSHVRGRLLADLFGHLSRPAAAEAGDTEARRRWLRLWQRFN